MESFYDIVVIGSGPGGQQAALFASKSGKRVAIVEKERELGGACVHQGTIPSKTLREAAMTIAHLKRSSEVFEFSLRKDLEVATLIERMDTVVHSYTDVIDNELKSNGVDIIKGRARIRDPQTVVVQSVDGRIEYLQTQHVILATGSRPRHPENIPVDHEYILDSDSILSMIYLPDSLTVIGGGVIGSEYASIFSILGVKVTLIDRAPRPLAFLDPELSDCFIESFQSHGGCYMGDQQIADVHWNGKDAVVTALTDGTVIESEKLLVASGRVSNIEGLGLADVGIELTNRGQIVVDEKYETNIPGVLAIGDLIGPPSLASTSMEQGRRAAAHCTGKKVSKPFESVPIGIYAVPEIASVGIDEKTASDRHGEANILIGKANYNEVARGQIMGVKNGFLKLIANKDDQKLLGVQIVGDGATELIHVGEAAIINGNSVHFFVDNVMNFPTLAEAYRIAAQAIIAQTA